MSQKSQILNHLKRNDSITALEAFGVYGVFRLAARIHELRQDGHDIRTEDRSDGQGRTYARYRLQ